MSDHRLTLTLMNLLLVSLWLGACNDDGSEGEGEGETVDGEGEGEIGEGEGEGEVEIACLIEIAAINEVEVPTGQEEPQVVAGDTVRMRAVVTGVDDWTVESWNMTARPAGSSASLQNSFGQECAMTVDVPGSYEILADLTGLVSRCIRDIVVE